LPIFITPSQPLREKASLVEGVTDDIRALVRDMTETMHAAPGVGLAAPQVGVRRQVFVWHWESDEGLHQGHVLNPSITLRGPWRGRFRGEPAEEGCLSIPGLRYPLARAERARLRGSARIFQHEYDHLQGVLYRDRLSRPWRREADSDIAESRVIGHATSWTPGLEGTEEDFFDSPDRDQPDRDHPDRDHAETAGDDLPGGDADRA
jgi:peptide deformylase